MRHNLKILPEYYEAVLDGTKTFEMRYNDRNFQVGDILRLREYQPMTDEYEARYTGRDIEVVITYILPLFDVIDNIRYVLPESYVIMSIKKMPAAG